MEGKQKRPMERHIIGVFGCVADRWRGLSRQDRGKRERIRRKGKWTNLMRLEEFLVRALDLS